jgi:hypothetical protein
MGNLKKALEEYKSFIKQFPRHPLADKAFQKVEQIAVTIATTPSPEERTLRELSELLDLLNTLIYVKCYLLN